MNEPKRFERDEYNQLVSKWCSGDLTEEESHRLREYLVDDQERLKSFAETCRLNALISQVHDSAVDPVSESGLEHLKHEFFETDLIVAPELGRGLQKFSTRRVSFSLVSVVAASMLFVVASVAGFLTLINPSPTRQADNVALTSENKGVTNAVADSQRSDAADVEGTPEAQVARIIRRIDCSLESDRWKSLGIRSFKVGQGLQVATGVVVIEFAKGAKVSLEGPAELEFLSDNSGYLYSGKLTAIVPPSAIGFEIQTTSQRVIDHGTEFGVHVFANGSTETHVFEGEVELVSDALNVSERLTTLMGAKSRRDQRNESISAKPEKFIRLLDRSEITADAAQRIQQLPIQSRPRLWFDASYGVQLDSASRVASWQNIGDPSGDTDAWQVQELERPVFEAESVGELPALSFSGSSSMITSPFARKSEVTMLVVAELSQREGMDNFQHILSFQGHPHLALDRTVENRIRARRFGVSSSDHTIINGEQGTPVDNLIVAGLRYSRKNNLFQLYVNGESIATAPAAGDIVEFSSVVIGCRQQHLDRHFSGKLAEIMVFNECLGSQQIELLSRDLMTRYHIPEKKNN